MPAKRVFSGIWQFLGRTDLAAIKAPSPIEAPGMMTAPKPIVTFFPILVLRSFNFPCFQLVVHSNMDSVYQEIPKEILPEEYGGTAGKIQDLIGKHAAGRDDCLHR